MQGVRQHQCACRHRVGDGERAACPTKKGLFRGMASGDFEGPEVPPIVHEVLRSPGHPLDQATRAFFEPRFGHDFSKVRIHTDAQASESARAVGAQAYTVGSDIVFGAHRHAPDDTAGRDLLAHELAHVVQQRLAAEVMPTRISQPSDPGEAHSAQMAHAALSGERHAAVVSGSSSPVLSRRVIPRLIHCTADSDGAPADPVAQLKTIVDQAEMMARVSASLLRFDAALTRADMRPMDSVVDQAFDSRFGLPSEVGGGFMNRLTGAVRPTLSVATSEEMELTARRLGMIADELGNGFIHYLCMTTTGSFGGCNITDCSRDAWACPNVNAIFLCPGFWAGGLPSSLLLIHETAHMIWESVIHGASGSGGNFRNAECYASFVADIFDVHRQDLVPECPNPE